MSNNYASFLTHPVFKVASQIITEKNLEAYVIGGYVRDLLLERPSKDIDIVVIILIIDATIRMLNIDIIIGL